MVLETIRLKSAAEHRRISKERAQSVVVMWILLYVPFQATQAKYSFLPVVNHRKLVVYPASKTVYVRSRQ